MAWGQTFLPYLCSLKHVITCVAGIPVQEFLALSLRENKGGNFSISKLLKTRS